MDFRFGFECGDFDNWWRLSVWHQTTHKMVLVSVINTYGQVNTKVTSVRWYIFWTYLLSVFFLCVCVTLHTTFWKEKIRKLKGKLEVKFENLFSIYAFAHVICSAAIQKLQQLLHYLLSSNRRPNFVSGFQRTCISISSLSVLFSCFFFKLSDTVSYNTYKNGFIEELMGKINPTVHAYISGDTSITPDCVRMHIKLNGTQQQKSVNTIANTFFAMRNSSWWLWDPRVLSVVLLASINIYR